MHCSRTFICNKLGALLVLGLATASPIEYDGELVARGNVQSSTPGDLAAACSGMTIVGYRTVKSKADGDLVNKNNKFPNQTPNGIDLGTAVYFSEGMGDWVGTGTDAQYCVAFAEPSKIPQWQKAWIPEQYNGQTIRGNDNKINAYITAVTSNQFDPAKTLRFSKLSVQTTFNQMAVPFGMLGDICGYCLPVAEAEKDGRDTRINYESGDFLAKVKQEDTGSGSQECKRDASSSGAVACMLSSTTSASSSQAVSSTYTQATPFTKATSSVQIISSSKTTSTTIKTSSAAQTSLSVKTTSTAKATLSTKKSTSTKTTLKAKATAK